MTDALLSLNSITSISIPPVLNTAGSTASFVTAQSLLIGVLRVDLTKDASVFQ